jgi:Xaa-Pro aminopeptidase
VAAFAPDRLRSRLDAVRALFVTHALDALVVTHPPNLQYLTGFKGTAGAIVLTRSACVLIVDFRYITAGRALVQSGGLEDVIRIQLADRSIDETIAATLKAASANRTGIEGWSMVVGRFNKLSAQMAHGAPTPLNTESPCPALVATERLVETVRIIKDDAEVATLREAARRLSSVARSLRQFLRPGRSEVEVATDIDAAMHRAGFERPAFETIVASGPNSALPHARPSLRTLQPGDGVVLDFGGVYDGYCVDLTRTVQLPPSTVEFERLFRAVAEAHAAAIQAVRPGVKGSEIDGAARGVLAAHALADAFGHGTGHGLGLEVHEDPRIARAVAGVPDVAVRAGMVFTIEPGAYVPDLGGVRIEDDVLVTNDGCEILTDVPIQM